MSQNNFPSTIPSVERLLNRIAVAERSQQKDVRISIQEAKELANDLALLTVKMSKTVQEVHQMLKEIKESTTQIDVKFDGGGF
jgi:methyl-accepting chemotaxis protein